MTSEIHTIGKFGTCGVIYAEVGTCTLCGLTAPVISADATEGEHHVAFMCEQCVRTALAVFTPVDINPPTKVVVKCASGGLRDSGLRCPHYMPNLKECVQADDCPNKTIRSTRV